MQKPNAKKEKPWTLEWAIEEACSLGITPPEAYHMTVAEINNFIKFRNFHESEISIATSWRIINFLGMFLAEKMQALERYLPDTPQRHQERVEREKILKEKFDTIVNKRRW